MAMALIGLALLCAVRPASGEEPSEFPPKDEERKELPPDTLTPIKRPERVPDVPPHGESEEPDPKPVEPQPKVLPPDTLIPIKSLRGEGEGEGPKDPPHVPGVTMGEGYDPDGLREVRVMPATGEVLPSPSVGILVKGPEAFVKAATGSYVLMDELGREVDRGTLKSGALKPTENGWWRFEVRTAHAVGVEHILTLTLSRSPAQSVERTTAFRITRDPAWKRWIALVHAPYSGQPWTELSRHGIRGGMGYRMHAERYAELKVAGVPFYVENVARQFLSRYHSQHGLWDETNAKIEKAPGEHTALAREPSFCHGAFGEAYAKELRRHAEHYLGEPVLFFSLAAEPSVTRLSAAGYFDFHPESLREFRRWLERNVYGTLKTLNQYWDTSFSAWDDVTPMTTPEARLRLRDGIHNYAPWCDFRAFMDHVFAKTLKDGANELRKFNPGAQAGITGALGPSAFGGWDWTRLAGALDVVEAYDIGQARALWRDLAPGKPALAMIPLSTQPSLWDDARRSLWNTALDGGPRGALLWDECSREDGKSARVLLDREGRPTSAAETLRPTLRELDGPLGLLLATARRTRPMVGLLYSPASVRLHWLFESDRLHGEAWPNAWARDTSAERRESPQYRLRESWAKILSDLGMPWRFVSSAEVEAGVLSKPDAGFKALVLPRAVALSDAEAEKIRAFAEAGGCVVADACCGHFDEHGRKRKTPALDALFGVNTAREPLTAEPERPLESIQDASEVGHEPLLLAKVGPELPPPYSDKPFWAGTPPPQRFEYRRAPALVRRESGKGCALFLNLNLEGYLRWRLHPDLPRAASARDAVLRLSFAPLLEDLPVDLRASHLPTGTELIWLTLGEGEGAARFLALRRNLQSRLHELGQAGDSNDCFARAEPFTLVLRQPFWTSNMLSDQPSQQNRVLEGTLDPVTPTLFALRSLKSPLPVATAPEDLKAGQALKLEIQPGPGADQAARVYGVRVLGPDGVEREHYSGAWHAPEGKLTVHIPLALNDPVGRWTLLVRDVVTGLESKIVVKVNATE